MFLVIIFSNSLSQPYGENAHPLGQVIDTLTHITHIIINLLITFCINTEDESAL